MVQDPSSPGFYSHLFVVPKANGELRPILDLSPLNRFLRRMPFKMESAHSIRQAISPGDWAVSIDLSDAYFHVLINQTDRKWLRFVWGNTVYQFRALPFGLSLSPWVFTKVVRELVILVHQLGIRLQVYLDDWLVLAGSQVLCSQNLLSVLSHAVPLGFHIQQDKSEFIPSTQFSYLGMTFDTLEWTVRPKRERLVKLQETLDRLLSRQSASAREISVLLGMMESLSALLPLGKAHKRPLQRAFALRWSQASGSWEDRLELGPWFHHATRQWMDQDWLNSSVPIRLGEPEMEIYTDASNLGWGAHVHSLTASGKWTEPQKSLHINELELLAAQLALDCFRDLLTGTHVRIVSDNTTVVAYLNHQGGTVSESLSTRAEQIVIDLWKRGIHLSARHLAGQANILADLLSRTGLIVPTEWTLSRQVLEPVWDLWGKPMIDLFATRFSARLPIFVSPVPDPLAWAVDALSFSWKGLFLYAFPPFALIPKVLLKVEVDQPVMLLIAPYWPARPWFPLLLKLSSSDPIPLNVRPCALVQPRSGVKHSNPDGLHLHAWRLSGGP